MGEECPFIGRQGHRSPMCVQHDRHRRHRLDAPLFPRFFSHWAEERKTRMGKMGVTRASSYRRFIRRCGEETIDVVGKAHVMWGSRRNKVLPITKGRLAD